MNLNTLREDFLKIANSCDYTELRIIARIGVFLGEDLGTGSTSVTSAASFTWLYTRGNWALPPKLDIEHSKLIIESGNRFETTRPSGTKISINNKGSEKTDRERTEEKP